MQQQQHVFDPNERVSISLPARLINVIFEVFRKTPGLPIPYDITNELLVEVSSQVQPPPAPAVEAQLAPEQLARLRGRPAKPNSEAQPAAE